MEIKRGSEIFRKTTKNEIIAVSLGRKGDIMAFVLTEEQKEGFAGNMRKFETLEAIENEFDFVGEWKEADACYSSYDVYK
jgi:hypothetical protein